MAVTAATSPTRVASVGVSNSQHNLQVAGNLRFEFSEFYGEELPRANEAPVRRPETGPDGHPDYAWFLPNGDRLIVAKLGSMSPYNQSPFGPWALVHPKTNTFYFAHGGGARIEGPLPLPAATRFRGPDFDLPAIQARVNVPVGPTPEQAEKVFTTRTIKWRGIGLTRDGVANTVPVRSSPTEQIIAQVPHFNPNMVVFVRKVPGTPDWYSAPVNWRKVHTKAELTKVRKLMVEELKRMDIKGLDRQVTVKVAGRGAGAPPDHIFIDGPGGLDDGAVAEVMAKRAPGVPFIVE